MLRMCGLACLAAATVVLVATASPAHGTTGGGTETLYYGKTSQGLGVSIPVRGTQIPRDMRAYMLFWIYKHTRSAIVEFHPGIYPGATSFRGGSLVYHRLAKLEGGTIEVWFQASLKQAGKVMTGSFRERDVGFSPVPRDTGTVRFTAVAYAAEQGREWSGATADGKPLRATVRYRLVPGHSVVNGRRDKEPRFTLALPAVTRPLVCKSGDGTATNVTASIPALSQVLSGSDDLANSFGYGGGLSGDGRATASARSANGTTVEAELAVKRLAWQGTGLAATGTLSYEATVSTETGTATCARRTSTFTLRPR
jgi:hypothetical protein